MLQAILRLIEMNDGMLEIPSERKECRVREQEKPEIKTYEVEQR